MSKTVRCKLCKMEARYPSSYTNAEIARQFGVSKDSARRHRMHADDVFGVPNELITQRGITRRLPDGSYEKITWKPSQGQGTELRDTLKQDLETLFSVPVPVVKGSTTPISLLVFPTDIQTGKGLKSDTPVFTPNGWTTHGELKVGDHVFGADGLPKKVLYVHDTTVRDLYEVSLRDGTKITCDEQHLWSGIRKMHPAGDTSSWEFREMTVDLPTLKQITEQAAARTRPFVLAPAHPVVLPERDLPIDPYVFGAWLGDGHAQSGKIFVGPSSDLEILQNLGKVSRRDHMFEVIIPGMYKSLREMGLLNNKTVPKEFTTGSVAQRLAFVQGLMDTDGSVSKDGLCEFTNTNEDIANALIFTLKSLGVRVRTSRRVGKLNGVAKKPYTRVNFRTELPVFRLSRKLERVRLATERVHMNRSVVSVEKVSPGEAQCITVEDSLYLVGENFTVTHNCDINGGTAEMVTRVRASVESIRKELEQGRVAELIIGELGDIIENFYNTSSQRETNDLNLMEQQRVARRLMAEIIATLTPYADKVVYVSVPSNHCAVRIGPKSPASTPDNDFGIEINHQLEEIFAGRQGYEHLSFVRPSDKHYEHVVYRSDVSNTTFFFAHGHKKNKPQMLGQLVSDLAAARIDGVENVDMAFFGHFHSMHLYQWHGRWVFVCPSSDGGSSWYTNQTGHHSTAGILAVDAQDGMWYNPNIH